MPIALATMPRLRARKMNASIVIAKSRSSVAKVCSTASNLVAQASSDPAPASAASRPTFPAVADVLFGQNPERGRSRSGRVTGAVHAWTGAVG